MKRIFCIATLLLPLFGLANNVQVGALGFVDESTLTFDLSWDNSWKTTDAPGNHDAVWVFVKLRANGGAWQHATLSTTGMDFSISNANLQVVPAADGMGVMVEPAVNSTGSRQATVTLRLAQPIGSGEYEFRVFAIEMVYVPEGPFWLGDSVSANALRAGHDSIPFRVESEAAIQVGSAGDQLSNQLPEYSPTGDIPAAWPKGYGGFYLMKYELSQHQFADFLNMLSFEGQQSHAQAPPTDPAGTLAMTVGPVARQSIRILQSSDGVQPAVYGCDANDNGTAGDAADAENRACNFLTWENLTAYLDWAALRPMTEFEFEKACRGPIEPLAGEFAWGTPHVADANTLVDDGHTTEAVSDAIPANAGLASHGYDGPYGPLRCGFAATATSDRLTAGSSYYGAMELSGNLWELCVTVTNDGLNYTPETGNGMLTDFGLADVSGWQGNIGGFRGGAFNSGIGEPGQYRDLAVSDRWYAGLDPTVRRNTAGGRGVR